MYIFRAVQVLNQAHPVFAGNAPALTLMGDRAFQKAYECSSCPIKVVTAAGEDFEGTLSGSAIVRSLCMNRGPVLLGTGWHEESESASEDVILSPSKGARARGKMVENDKKEFFLSVPALVFKDFPAQMSFIMSGAKQRVDEDAFFLRAHKKAISFNKLVMAEATFHNTEELLVNVAELRDIMVPSFQVLSPASLSSSSCSNLIRNMRKS